MKARIVLLAVLLMVAVAGCGKPEEPLPSIRPMTPGAGQSQVSAQTSGTFSTFAKLPAVTAEPDPDGVSFLGIGFGADGAYVMVSFKASLNLVNLWRQDGIYVVDEETHGVYKDIPVLPIVGPLIGKPQQEGPPGYVMLQNYYNGIKSGSVVTVVLGNYKREHVKVP